MCASRLGLLLVGTLMPFLAFATPFPAPLPTIKQVGLQLSVQVGGKSVKSPAVVAANTDFSVAWKSQGVGCVGDWTGDTLPPTGSVSGSITANRTFIVTCFGRGAAQSAKAQVNVGVADLTVSSFSAAGLKGAKGQRGTFTAGPFTLKASVRNFGKLPIATPFKVKLQESENGTSNWTSAAEQTVPALGGGATLRLDEWPRQGNAGAATRHYQVCVDTENKVSESKEDNNCSKVLGPYSFVAAP